MRPLKVARYDGQPINRVERKYDGHRINCRGGRAMTRTHHDMTDDLRPMFGDAIWAHDFDAELYSSNHPPSMVKALVARHDPSLRLAVFSGWSSAMRTHRVHEAHVVAEYRRPRTADEGAMERLALRQGWEGVVLVNTKTGRRFKVKPEHTIDCVVSGIAGRSALACVYVMKRMVEIASVPMYGHRVKLGDVIEVQHDGVMTRRLRAPRLLRVRTDKPAAECRASQDPALLG